MDGWEKILIGAALAQNKKPEKKEVKPSLKERWKKYIHSPEGQLKIGSYLLPALFLFFNVPAFVILEMCVFWGWKIFESIMNQK